MFGSLTSLFGAKDDGLKGHLKDTGKAWKGIEESTNRATGAGIKFELLMQSFSLKKLMDIDKHLQTLGNGLDSAAGKLGGGSGLESKLQEQRVQFDKSFRGMAVSAGVTGDALRKMEGEAFSLGLTLNKSSDEIAKSMLEMKKRGFTPSDLGLDTMADFVKVLDVTGMSADALVDNVGSLRRSYGLSAKQASEMMDSIVGIGQANGMGAEAFRNVTKVIGDMDSAFSKSMRNQSPETIMETTKSITMLAASMAETTGVGFEEALSDANKLFSDLSENAEALPDMMAGLGGDFGDLTNQLAMIHPGGMQDIMKMMEDGAKDPAKFASEMSGLMAELDGTGESGRVMKEHLLEAMSKISPGLSFFIQKGDAVAQSLARMEAKAGDTSGALKDLGRQGYTTGRTLEDQMGLAKDTLEDVFKSLGHDKVKKSVKAQVKGYKSLGDTLRVFGTEITPRNEKALRKQAESLGYNADQVMGLNSQFGGLIRTTSAFESGGLAAVVFGSDSEWTAGQAAISATLSAAQGLGAQFIPFAGAMRSLGIDFSAVGKGFGMLAKPIQMFGGFVFGPLKYLAMVISPILGGLGMPVVAFAAAIGGVVAAGYLLSKALDGTLGPTIGSFSENVKLKLATIFDFGKGAFGRAKKGLSDFGSSVLGGLRDIVKEVDFNAMAGDVSSGISSAMKSISGLFEGVDLTKSVSGIADSVIGGLKTITPDQLMGFVNSLSDGIGKALTNFKALRTTIGEKFREAISGVNWSEVSSGVFGAVGGYYKMIFTKWKEISQTVTKVIQDTDWEAAAAQLSQAVTSFFLGAADPSESDENSKVLGGAFSSIATSAMEVLKDPELWDAAGEMLIAGAELAFAVLKASGDVLSGIGRGVMTAIVDSIFGEGVSAKFTDGYKSIFEKIDSLKDALSSLAPVGDVLGLVFGAIVDTILMPLKPFILMYKAVKAVVGILGGGDGEGGGLSGAFSSVMTTVGDWMSWGMDRISDFKEGATGLLGGVSSYLVDVWGSIGESLAGFAGSVFEAANTVATAKFNLLKNVVTGIFQSIADFFTRTWERVKNSVGSFGGVLTSLADKLGLNISGVMPPVPISSDPDSVSTNRRASVSKLIEQRDEEVVVLTLREEFRAQNEILVEIARKLGGVGVPSLSLSIPGGGSIRSLTGSAGGRG